MSSLSDTPRTLKLFDTDGHTIFETKDEKALHCHAALQGLRVYVVLRTIPDGAWPFPTRPFEVWQRGKEAAVKLETCRDKSYAMNAALNLRLSGEDLTGSY